MSSSRIALSIPLLAAIAGCGPVPDGADGPAPLQGDALAPPYALTVPDLYQGSSATFTATGGLPGERIWLAGSSVGAGTGPCPAVLGGTCVGLDSATLLGSAVADATGSATFTVNVPATVPDGTLLYAQALFETSGAAGASSVRTAVVYAASCATTVPAFWAEAEAVRACTTDAECGQVLSGTSCGCTRNWVANLSADTIQFYQLLGDAGACGVALDSPCDCPAANGFLCDGGQCTWDYGTP